MQITILTIVVSLWMADGPVSSEWITMNMDSARACELVAETLKVTTAVENDEYWAGSTYVVTVFCDSRVIERLDDEGN